VGGARGGLPICSCEGGGCIGKGEKMGIRGIIEFEGGSKKKSKHNHSYQKKKETLTV